MMPRSYFCVCTFICAWVCASTYVYMRGLYVPGYMHAHMCTRVVLMCLGIYGCLFLLFAFGVSGSESFLHWSFPPP